MKVQVWVSYNYGAYSLKFVKDFDLPFAPFYNMVLFDTSDNFTDENDIRLVNNDYCDTNIIWYATDEFFEVDVRNIWKHPVTDSTIDDIIKKFFATKWDREDTEDIAKLKQLMKKEHGFLNK